MGYYTRFELEIRGDAEEVRRLTVEAAEYVGEACTLGLIHAMLSDYDRTWKWYEHEEDMAELSRAFPELTFVLSGEGEENDDVWRKFFKNGVCKPQETERRWGDEPSFEEAPQ